MAETEAILTAIKDSNAAMITSVKEGAAGTEKAIDKLARAIENIPAISERIAKPNNGQPLLMLVAVVSIIGGLLSPVYISLSNHHQQVAEIKSDVRERDDTIKYLIDLRRYATDEQHGALKAERILIIDSLERRLRCLEAGEIHDKHDGG